MIEIIQRYRIALPSPLAMLIKVLVMLEGTGRLLQPNFSLMELMQPYQKKMLRRRLSPARQMRKSAAHLLRGGAAGRGAAAPAARYSAAGRKRQVRRAPRSPRPGAVGESAGAGHVDQLAVSRLVAADQPQTCGRFTAYRCPARWACCSSAFLGWRLLRAIGKSGRLDRRK